MATQTNGVSESESLVLQNLGSTSDGPQVIDYLGVFSRRPFMIFLPPVILAVVAMIIALILPPKYESFTIVKVKDSQLLNDLVGRSQVELPYKPQLKTITSDIRRTSFIEPIIEKIRLTEGFDLKDPREKLELYKYIYQNLVIDLKSPNVGPDIIKITYQGRDAVKTMEFVNEIRTAYQEDFNEDYFAAVQETHEQLKLQKSNLEERLAVLRAEREKFETEENIQLLNTEADKRRILGDLVTKRLELETAVSELEVSEKALQREVLEVDETVMEPTLIRNPKMIALHAALDALQAKFVEYTEVRRWTRETPLVKELEEKLKTTRAQIELMKPEEFIQDRQVVKLNPQYGILVAKLQDTKRSLLQKHGSLRDFRAQIEVLAAETRRIPALTAQRDKYEETEKGIAGLLRQVTTDFTRVKNTFDSVREKGDENFQVLEYPDDTGEPVFPIFGVFLGAGAGIGLLLGLAMAFLKEFAGMTFSTPTQVSNVMPVPVLGSVSRIRTDGERRQERRKRVRIGISIGVGLSVIVLVHVFYFSDQLVEKLPAWLVSVLDQLYRAR